MGEGVRERWLGNGEVVGEGVRERWLGNGEVVGEGVRERWWGWLSMLEQSSLAHQAFYG